MTITQEDLRSRLDAVWERIKATRAQIGVAIADGSDAARIRAELAALEDEALGLEAAIPVAEQRAAQAEAAAAAAAKVEIEKRQAEVRERRRRAARRVDDAMRRLGRAFSAYVEAEGTNLRHLRQRSFAVKAALHRWAPEFAVVIEVGRVPQGHRRGLEECENL